MMRIALAAMLALIAAPAAAQEPPDYIGFMAQVERLAVAATSARSCEHFGYPNAEAGLRAQSQRIIDDAVRAGMPAGDADQLLAGAIEAEGKRLAARSADLEARKSDPAALDAFLDYWEGRCASLASDPVYGVHFRR